MKALTVHVICLLGILACVARGQSSDGTNARDDAERKVRDDERQALKEKVSRAKIDELVEDANTTESLLKKLQEQDDAFSPRLESLKTNDDGRRLALDDSTFLSIMDLEKNPVVSKEEIASKTATITAISDELKKLQHDLTAGVIPPASVVEEIADIRQWAKDSLIKIDTTQSMLTAAIAREKDADIKSAPTLKEKIDAYRLAQIEFLNKARLKGEEGAKQEAQDKVSAAAREAELLRAQEESDRLLRETRAELERVRIENEMQLAKIKNEEAEKEAALKHDLAVAQAARTTADAQNQVIVQKAAQDADFAKKRQQCHADDVKATLQPFISNGLWQPKSGRGIDSKPMSLGEMRSAGALEPTKEGLELLMKCANLRANDRPTWGQFERVGLATKEQIELTKKAQGYLNDLGDALVAEGMLSP